MSSDPSDSTDEYDQCIYHSFIGGDLEDVQASRKKHVANYVSVMTTVWNIFSVLHIINLVVMTSFCVYFVCKKEQLSWQRWL